MAKKKRRTPKKKEEEYEFIPPEFDEEEFLINDIRTTKVAAVTSLLAVILGVFAFFLTEFVGVYGGLLLFLVSIGALGTILRLLRLDVDNIERKSMLGNYIMFFMLFLAVWIICMNPPVSDHVSPEISKPTLLYDGNEVELQGDTFTVQVSGDLEGVINVVVTDNGKIDNVIIKVSEEEYPMEYVGNNTYSYTLSLSPNNTYPFTIYAEDTAGNNKISSFYRVVTVTTSN